LDGGFKNQKGQGSKQKKKDFFVKKINWTGLWIDFYKTESPFLQKDQGRLGLTRVGWIGSVGSRSDGSDHRRRLDGLARAAQRSTRLDSARAGRLGGSAGGERRGGGLTGVRRNGAPVADFMHGEAVKEERAMACAIEGSQGSWRHWVEPPPARGFRGTPASYCRS